MAWTTVNDMYKLCKAEEVRLLSDFSADFWSEYKENHVKYDKLFATMYKSFRYYGQESDTAVDDVTEDFIEHVEAWLMINEKRLHELYRIQLVSDTDYNILNNYKITETYSGEGEKNGSETYGTREDSFSNTTGERTDTTTDTIGSVHESTENGIQGFNSSTYKDDTKSDFSADERTNDTTFVKGSETTEGSSTKGSQNNSNQSNESQTYTRTKEGNAGETPSEVMAKHKRFWDAIGFYSDIFKDICRDLLLV